MADEVFKTLVFLGAGDRPTVIDTIEFGEQLWLVAKWSEPDNSGRRWPARAILLSALDYAPAGPLGPKIRWVLPEPIAIEAYEGRQAAGGRYVVQPLPDALRK